MLGGLLIAREIGRNFPALKKDVLNNQYASVDLPERFLYGEIINTIKSYI
jgi:hypothetical protein